jgi:hypothetical protein
LKNHFFLTGKKMSYITPEFFISTSNDSPQGLVSKKLRDLKKVPF